MKALGTSGARAKLDYPFVPIPTAAMRAIRDGNLSSDEFVGLSYLFYIGREGRRKANCTLAQIAEGTHWQKELDTLSKLLRRLKAKGWIDYPSSRGGQGFRYEITLHREPRASELVPSSQASANAALKGCAVSASPSCLPLDPSSLAGDAPSLMPNSPTATDALVRVPQKGQREKLGYKEGLPGAQLSSNKDHLVGEGAEENEERILADLQALVDADEAEWIVC